MPEKREKNTEKPEISPEIPLFARERLFLRHVPRASLANRCVFYSNFDVFGGVLRGKSRFLTEIGFKKCFFLTGIGFFFDVFEFLKMCFGEILKKI
jgi:hypothetical protein